MMEVQGNVDRLIHFAVRAGRYRQAARECPAGSHALLQAAELNSAKVGAYAAEVCADAAQLALSLASAAPPHFKL